LSAFIQQISIENNTINAPVIGSSSANNAGMICDDFCLLYIKGIKGFNFMGQGQGQGQGHG
jgi:hypothetical protein